MLEIVIKSKSKILLKKTLLFVNITYAIQIHNNIENDKEQENYLDSSTPQTILLTNGIEKLDINWWFTTS